MPINEDFSLWYFLIPLILIALAVFITFVFTKSKFQSKINTLQEKSDFLSTQWNEQKQEFVERLNQLKLENNQNNETQNHLIDTLRKEFNDIENQLVKDKELLSVQLSKREVENQNLNQKLIEEKEQLNELNLRFQKEFENLANKILEEKSQKFTNQNKENLEILLNPLQERIKGFEKRVEDSHKESLERNASLRQQIIGLKELNEQMSKEANNLTKALKGDTKMQGNWGELVLSKVLERSGLEKDKEYFVQQSFYTEENRRVFPDVIVHMPDNKKIIIDSKVSLNAYENYVNETEEENKPNLLKLHIQSIRNHVTQLSGKNYHQLYDMDSPDFVMLFIPIEAAFAVASHEYPQLYSDAFERNIIIVTPTTLLAVLKTIDTLWQNEKQKQNTLEIAKQAGALYDTFVNLTDELTKLGRQINTVQNSYQSSMKKLTGKGNLVGRVQKLKKLGAKASKEIDQKLQERAKLENYTGDEEE